MREGFEMSKMSRHVYGMKEDARRYWGAMDAAKGKTLSDLSPEQINSMVWSARLWLRGLTWGGREYLEQILLAEDARAEITRRAMEAEQTADYREGVGV
jgi:hypothetical protein